MKNLVLTILSLFFLVSIAFGQVENPRNKYDYAGSMHNDAMRYVFEKVSDRHKKPSAEEITGWIMEWFESIVPQNGMNINKNELVQLMLRGINQELNLQSSNPSNTFSGYYFSLGSLLENYNGGEGNLNPLLNEIKLLENGIMKSNLGEREKGSLLISASVARYSIYYWTTTGTQWVDLNGGQGNTEFVWGEVGRADMQGAAGGAAGGLAAGTVVLPIVGSVAGWVAGGIGVGAAVSAADVLWQIFQ